MRRKDVVADGSMASLRRLESANRHGLKRMRGEERARKVKSRRKLKDDSQWLSVEDSQALVDSVLTTQAPAAEQQRGTGSPQEIPPPPEIPSAKVQTQGPVSKNRGAKGSLFEVREEIVLRHPMRMLLYGPSGCGKSTFITRLLSKVNTVISPAPKEVYYFFGLPESVREVRDDFPFVSFNEGLPTAEGLQKLFGDEPAKPRLLIFDDLLTQAGAPELLHWLFVQGSHHLGCSVIVTGHNVFTKANKANREMRLNATHTAYFKNPADNKCIQNVGQQRFGAGGSTFMTAAYRHATEAGFRSLLVDNTQMTPECKRLWSGGLDDDGVVTYYVKTGQTCNFPEDQVVKKEDLY